MSNDAQLHQLVEQIHAARERRAPLNICGGGSKIFYGGMPRGDALHVGSLEGISSYEPTELVVTARAGTKLVELEKILVQKNQYLAFDPPQFSASATVGGMVAAGLAGPARASVGGVRDYVLGVALLNGRGELMRFGGQVIKNVAGYDVSRLAVGSMGVLGVICEVSLKVLPLPAVDATLQWEIGANEALEKMNQWRGQPLPINATSWFQGRLRLRLRGSRAAVQAASDLLRGSSVEANEGTQWWTELRDHRQAFFKVDAPSIARDQSLWRLSVPATAQLMMPSEEVLIEWAGALRWWRTSLSAETVRNYATQAGGHATLFYGGDKSFAKCTPFAPLSEASMRIHRNLKTAFDPDNLFNPGRLCADF